MIEILSDIDHDQILLEYRKLEPNIIWNDNLHKGKQTGLQYRSNDDVWTSATGKAKWDPREFALLNPAFKDTVFEEIINKYKLLRTRLMWLGANSCYSFHMDTCPRVHVPIITNSQCFIIFYNGPISHLTAGKVYRVDTTQVHTAMNGSDEWRLHLVGEYPN